MPKKQYTFNEHDTFEYEGIKYKVTPKGFLGSPCLKCQLSPLLCANKKIFLHFGASKCSDLIPTRCYLTIIKS